MVFDSLHGHERRARARALLDADPEQHDPQVLRATIRDLLDELDAWEAHGAPLPEAAPPRGFADIDDAHLQLRSLFQSIPDLIWLKDVSGAYLACNSAFERFIGAGEAEILGKTDFALFSAAEAAFFREKDAAAIAAGGPCTNTEWLAWASNGYRGLYETIKTPMFTAEGRLIGVLGIAREITAMHQAQQSMRESEARYRTLFELSPDGIGMFTPAGVISYANQQLATMIGASSPAEIEGRSVFAFVPPDHVDQSRANFSVLFVDGAARREMVLRRLDGSLFDCELSSAAVRDEQGALLAFISQARDITERTQAQQAMQAERQHFLALFENTPVATWLEDFRAIGAWMDELRRSGVSDLTAYLAERPGAAKAALSTIRVLDMNHAAVALSGADSKTHLIANLDRLFSHVNESALIEELETLWKGDSRFEFEMESERLDGARQHLITRVDIPKQGGVADLSRVIVTSIDVTERVRAARALAASERRFQLAMEASHEGLWEWDLASGRATYSPAYFSILGREFEPAYSALSAQFWLEWVHPDDRARVLEMVTSCLEGRIESFDIEYRMQHQDGSWRWILGRGKVLARGPDGRVLHVIGTTMEISARKLAEEQLRKLSRAVEQSSVSIEITDREGRFEYVNPQFTRITGYSAAEVMGKRPSLLQSGITPPAVYRQLWSTILAGGEWRGEMLNRRKGGELFWEAMSISPIRNADGQITHFLAVKEDVSDRKRAEDALRSRTAELETLFTLSTALSVARSAEEIMALVLAELRGVLFTDAGLVCLLEPGSQKFTIAYADGLLSIMEGQQFATMGSICGRVASSGQAVLIKDLGCEQTSVVSDAVADLGPAAFVPLVAGAEILGAFAVARLRDTPQFTAAELRLLSAIGQMVGVTLQRAQLSDHALRRLGRLQSLHHIDRAITSSLNVALTLNVVLAEVLAQLNADIADVLLLNHETGMLEYAAGLGFRSDPQAWNAVLIGTGIAGQIAARREVASVRLDAEGDRFLRKQMLAQENAIVYHGAPMIARGQVIGVLEVLHRTPFVSTPEWVEFLEAVATQAAIAIDNGQMFAGLQQANQELSRAYDATIAGWSRALDLRDKETEGHSERVTELTLQLAQAFGIPSADLVHVRRGALLHDIGKMGIPDQILLKPGKLSDEEWEIMRRHPGYAHELLSPIAYLWPALDIPYCHHEKWDGSGYPRGLAGEDIPLAARIFAVVDVWDALTNDRPYRPAWPIAKTIDFIRAERGRHFDPAVVDAFLALIE